MRQLEKQQLEEREISVALKLKELQFLYDLIATATDSMENENNVYDELREKLASDNYGMGVGYNSPTFETNKDKIHNCPYTSATIRKLDEELSDILWLNGMNSYL